MKPRAYVETTIPSYLTALPSRDLLVAAHQQVTREWWEGRDAFDIYISQLVLDEASGGDAGAAARRIEALRNVSVLDVTTEAAGLARRLLDGGGLPPEAKVDALHVAVATVHGMHYLLTWNCVHIANAARRGRIEQLCRMAGFEPPIICTPIELTME